MTEQQIHIPMFARAAMLEASREQRNAADWTDREAYLRQQIDEHRQKAETEEARIRAHVEEEHRKAKAHLDAVTAKAQADLAELKRAGDALDAQYTEAGRAASWHARQAQGAEHAIATWCDREGIDPATLPPVSDGSGPLAVVDDKALVALGAQLARPAETTGDLDVTRVDPLPAATVDGRADLGGEVAPGEAQFHRGDPSQTGGGDRA